MTPTPPSSTAALWARFRFSVVGSLLSSPPATGAQDRHPLPGREDLVSSRHRTRRPVLGRHHRAVVLHGAGASTTTPSPSSAAPCARTAARSPWPRPSPSGSVSSTASTRTGATNCTTTTSPLGEGRSRARAAPLLCHGPTLHAGSRLDAAGPRPQPRQAPAKHRRNPTPNPRDPQLRSPVRRRHSGISTSTTARSRCSPTPAASGCARSRWASSTTTRDSAATSSGTSPRPPRTWSTDSPRRSRNAGCPVLS